MARLNRGPNGPFSGKVGSVIGSSWRQIYYIKGLQKKSRKERSPLQIEQQNKFALAVKFLRGIKDILDLGFSKVNPGGATGYNMAISHMLNHSIKGHDPELSIDYASVMIAKGNLHLPERVNMTLDGLTLKLDWSTEVIERWSFTTDQVYLLVYYPDRFSFQVPPKLTPRDAGEVSLEPDHSYPGNTVHVYFYLTNPGIKRWSNSLYLGPLKLR